MRNLKKMAALGAAAVMALSVNVSAFAAVTGSATASYDNGKVILSTLADIDADHQWTVVVISADKANDNLTADDLYYINQGTNGETFWTNGMGTKTELADGNYIVRIGGETIDTLEQLIEIPLTVKNSETPDPEYKLGDVNSDNSINMSDAAAVLNHFTGDAIITDAIALLAADVNKDSSINMSDAAAILNHFTGDALIQ